MSSEKEGSLVARAVREALGTLVSPQLAGQIVTRALASTGLSAIPESGRAIATFIEGALRREIESSVGSDAAELVAAQLAPIIAHAGSAAAAPASGRSSFTSERPTGVMPSQVTAPARRQDLARTARVRLTAEQMQQLQRPPEDGRTTRPQPSGDESPNALADALPRVLAACAEPRAVEALRNFLTGTASVTQIPDLVSLLDALEEPGLSKPIVLLDCRRPTVHVSSVAAIGEDLPKGTAVVLWGATDAVWRDLDRDRVPSCRWVRCSQEATTEDLGSLCSMLVG